MPLQDRERDCQLPEDRQYQRRRLRRQPEQPGVHEVLKTEHLSHR